MLNLKFFELWLTNPKLEKIVSKNTLKVKEKTILRNPNVL